MQFVYPVSLLELKITKTQFNFTYYLSERLSHESQTVFWHQKRLQNDLKTQTEKYILLKIYHFVIIIIFFGGGGGVWGTMFEYYYMIHWQEIQFPVSTCKQGIGHGSLAKCRHKSDYVCAILEIDHIIDACRSILESKERIWSAALVLLHSFNIYRCIPMKVFE